MTIQGPKKAGGEMGSSERTEFELLMNFNADMNSSAWVQICGFLGNAIARRGLASTVPFYCSCASEDACSSRVLFLLGLLNGAEACLEWDMAPLCISTSKSWLGILLDHIKHHIH